MLRAWSRRVARNSPEVRILNHLGIVLCDVLEELAGVLDDQMSDEITEQVLDVIPDSSFEPSWVEAYLNEWKRNGTGWWEEHDECVEEIYHPLLEQNEEEAT